MAKKSTHCRRSWDPLSRLADGILRKLEVNRCVRYETVLTAEEYNEAVLMIRAAVAFARSRLSAKRMPPRTFPWRGRNYALRYSNTGRVFIATKSGITLIGSDYFVI